MYMYHAYIYDTLLSGIYLIFRNINYETELTIFLSLTANDVRAKNVSNSFPSATCSGWVLFLYCICIWYNEVRQKILTEYYLTFYSYRYSIQRIQYMRHTVRQKYLQRVVSQFTHRKREILCFRQFHTLNISCFSPNFWEICFFLSFSDSRMKSKLKTF